MHVLRATLRRWLFAWPLPLVWVIGCAGTALAAEQPNLLIVITDEHNFRTLGCYREQLPREQAEMWGAGNVVETPNLDRIATEGVLCTRAYATAPVCSPCRAAMITGLYPHQTGVPANNFELRADIPTLATILGSKGYRCGFIGKWHLGGSGKPAWAPAIDGGFAHKEFMFNRGHWKKFVLTDEGPRVGARNRNGEPNYNVDGADETTFATDFLTDRTIEFMANLNAEPFLAVVSYPDPHGPNTVRAPYDRMYAHLRFAPPRTYGREDADKPGWLAGSTANHAKFRGDQMSLYFGMVKCLDDNVGRLLQFLEDRGVLDSTIVVMTSDHGDLCYEHDRLNKGNPYEGSARVPLLIRYPERLPSGHVHQGPVGTVDLTPSLLGLASLDSDAMFSGRDLSEVWSGAPSTANVDVTFLRNAGTKPAWIAAIDSRYKLILSTNDRPWLFDGKTDPDELLNFYGRPGVRAVTRQLAEALQTHCARVSDPFAEHPQIAASLQDCLTE